MTKPTINLNGTHPQELAELYTAAALAVYQATEAVAKSCPNGRDYQTQDPREYTRARVDHCSRLGRLSDIREELESLAMHCQDADERNARRPA